MPLFGVTVGAVPCLHGQPRDGSNRVPLLQLTGIWECGWHRRRRLVHQPRLDTMATTAIRAPMGLHDSNTSGRASAIGPRMPKPSKPRYSHSSTTSPCVLNKRPFHCLPSGVATRGIGIAPTSGLQWREIA